MARTINGLDIDEGFNIKEEDQVDPKRAWFVLRARTEWSGRARSLTRIQTSYGESFAVEGDEPPSLLGEGRAPKAVEYILHSLGAYLAVGLAYNAMAAGIKVRSESR